MATGGSSLSQMSDEILDFVCTACHKENRTLEAVRYCVECSAYCCQECTDLHSRFPLLKGHTLLGHKTGNQRLPEYPTKLCRLHEGKVLDRYCEHHNEVVCEMCVQTNHRSCSKRGVYSVHKMIGTLFKLDDCNQVQSRLRDMKETMTTIGFSHDSLLEALKDAKKKELEKVLNFQKGLDDIIRKGKAAEDLKHRIECKYNEVEREILQGKQNAERNKDSMNELEDKFIKAKGNRADHFVCTKLAEKLMLEADSCMLTQKLNYHADIQLQFTPNQSLIDYMNGLNCIGEINVTLKKKPDLYRIKGCTSIGIKTSATEPGSLLPDRCYVTRDHQLLVTDAFNKNLLRFDIEKLTLIDSCKLDSTPYGICSISMQEVIVACSNNLIQFVSLRGTMATTRQVKMSHLCHSVTAWEDKYYVADPCSKLYVYGMDDELLACMSKHNGKGIFSRPYHITFNENGKKMYVTDWDRGIVCIDDVGNYLCTFTDSALLDVDGVCVDGRGNIFVVGQKSHNVVQFNEDGKKVGVVIQKADGLHRPCSVSFDPKLNRLFVGMLDNDVVKIYDLE